MLSPFLHLLDNLVYSVLPFVFVISIVVFFHELGHFLTGRWLGVKADVFSLGFGPELLSWRDGKGTLWRLAAIPVGGYVKFHGDEYAYSAGEVTRLQDEAAYNSDAYKSSLQAQPVWKRFLIVLAGPVFNFVLAICIFTLVFCTFGISQIKPRVGNVRDGSAAQDAGLKPGDLIVSINGNVISNFRDIQSYIVGSAGEPMALEVMRGDEKLSLVASPRLQEVKTASGTRKISALGLTSSRDPADMVYVVLSPLGAFNKACLETYTVVSTTMSYLRGIIFGRETADQISGPIGVAQIASQTARDSLVSLIMLTALFSISIGLMNLFPIPLLDGGHLVFYILEFMRGRPISPRVQEISMRFGIVVVGFLLVFATSNDLIHLFSLR